MEKRVVGGVMLILAFIFALVAGAHALFAGAEAGGIPLVGGFLEDLFTICAIVEIIFGIIGLLGAVMAITGKSWGIALVGAIFAMLSIGFWFLGFVFGLVGLVLIAVSQDEFGPRAPPPAPMPPYGAPPP